VTLGEGWTAVDATPPDESEVIAEQKRKFELLFGVSEADLVSRGVDPGEYARTHIHEAMKDRDKAAVVLPRSSVLEPLISRRGFRVFVALFVGIGFLAVSKYEPLPWFGIAASVAAEMVAIAMWVTSLRFRHQYVMACRAENIQPVLAPQALGQSSRRGFVTLTHRHEGILAPWIRAFASPTAERGDRYRPFIDVNRQARTADCTRRSGVKYLHSKCVDPWRRRTAFRQDVWAETPSSMRNACDARSVIGAPPVHLYEGVDRDRLRQCGGRSRPRSALAAAA
jgi:hypothetical protein